MQHAPRRLRRHHLIFYLKVFDRDSGDQLGFLGDITVEGMMVMSKSPIELEQEFEIEIRSQSEGMDTPVVACRARSLWCHTDVNPDYHATGFRFERISAEGENAVRGLIREIGFDASPV